MSRSTPPTEPERRTASGALRQLRHGHAADPVADYGSYRDGIAALIDALADDGQSGVERAYTRLCHTDPAWIALGAADSPPERAPRMPPLPDAAREIESVTTPAGAWLDSYLLYAGAAAPMSPASFHEAAGLFLASLAIARRAFVQSGPMRIWPSLWYLCVAIPGKYKKTAAQDVALGVLDDAGLSDLRLQVDSLTPEALINTMNPTFLRPNLRSTERDGYIRRRRWANTRGWLNDETHQVFLQAKRDYNTELIPMLLKMYNGASYTKATAGRGEEQISDPYLSILGASTPSSMRPFLGSNDLWESGMWSRFILLKPDQKSEWAQEVHDARPPYDLTCRLKDLFQLFDEPGLALVGDPVKDKDVFLQHHAAEAVQITVDDDASRAWQAYRKALEYDLIDDDDSIRSVVPELLQPSYIRFPGVAMRIAILLAALDAADQGTAAADIRIEARHYARAQRMTERYRATLHAFYDANVRTEESSLQQRIMRYLATAKTALTQHALCELTHAKAKDMKESLELLDQAGRVACVASEAKNGRKVILWTCADRTLEESKQAAERMVHA